MQKPTVVQSGDLSKQIFAFEGGSLRLIQSPRPVLHCEAVDLPDYLFYWILAGKKRFFSGHAQWLLNTGDAILVRRQSAVSCEAEQEADTAFAALSIHMSRELLEAFVQHHQVPESGQTGTANACVYAQTERDGGFEGCLQSLRGLFDTDTKFWDRLLHHKIQELLLHLLHPESPSTRALAVCAEVLSGRRKAYLEMLNQVIAEPISTEAMAQTLAMSLSAFKREFKQLFGETPARYLMQRRLERAQQLLLTTPEPVQRIAAGTGFENPSHFARAFKRAYGRTPVEYREYREYRNQWPGTA